MSVDFEKRVTSMVEALRTSATAMSALSGQVRATAERVTPHNPQDLIVKLINEKNIKIEDFHGIQDARNQVPYLQRARQMTNFIKTQGAPGTELVEAMDWAVNQDRLSTFTEAKIHEQYPAMALTQTLHVLQLFIENHIKGHARDVVTTDPTNGLDSWRKLYNDQLPDKEFQIQRLKEEHYQLTKARSIKEFRETQGEFDRIIARWTELSGASWSEAHTKLL